MMKYALQFGQITTIFKMWGMLYLFRTGVSGRHTVSYAEPKYLGR